MANTEIKGKVVLIEQPTHVVYSAFADLRNFVNALPPDKKDGITATADTIEGNVKGFQAGVQIINRVPFSLIFLKDYGNSMFPFEIGLVFETVEGNRTNFHIELSAELNFMIKSMIGGKLQEAVDQMSEQLAMAMNGKLDMSKMDPNNFNMDNFS